MAAPVYDKKCCDELIWHIEKVEKLSYTLESALSQYFDNLETTISEVQEITGTILHEIHRTKGKWDFHAVQEVATITAQISVAVAGAAFSEAKSLLSKEALGDALWGASTTALLQKASSMDEGPGSFVETYYRRTKKRSEENREHLKTIHKTLDELDAIAQTLQACFHCAGLKPRIPDPQDGNIDPAHAVNQIFQDLCEEKEAPCDICVAIQGLLDYIAGQRYIFHQRLLIMQLVLSNALTVNKNTLEALNLVNKDIWNQTAEGKLGDIVTSGLAALTPWGAAAKAITESVFTYLQKKHVRSRVEDLLDLIRSGRKHLPTYLRWATEQPGGDWRNYALCLERKSLWKLTRYRYGKCPHPCAEPEPTERPEPASHSADTSSPDAFPAAGGPAVRLPGGSGFDEGVSGDALREKLPLWLISLTQKPILIAGLLALLLITCGVLWWFGRQSVNEVSPPVIEDVVSPPEGVSEGGGPGDFDCDLLLQDQVPGFQCRTNRSDGKYRVLSDTGQILISETPFNDSFTIPLDNPDLISSSGMVITVIAPDGSVADLYCVPEISSPDNLNSAIKLVCQMPDGSSFQGDLTWQPPGGDLSCEPLPVVIFEDGQPIITCPDVQAPGTVTVFDLDGNPLTDPVQVQAGDTFEAPTIAELGPGLHDVIVGWNDLWGREIKQPVPIFQGFPGVMDSAGDGVVCGSTDPANDSLPPFADIRNVFLVQPVDAPPRIYVQLNGALPDNQWWYGAISEGTPYNGTIYITASNREFGTFGPGTGYWLTDGWFVILPDPDFLTGAENLYVFFDGDPCDFAGPFPPFGGDVDFNVFVPDNLPAILPDFRGDAFDRNNGQIFDDPVSDIQSVRWESNGSNVTLVVQTGEPFTDEWSRAVEIRFGNQSCLDQSHNGVVTIQGAVSSVDNMTACTFSYPSEFPVVITVNTYRMPSPDSPWTGDQAHFTIYDSADLYVLRFSSSSDSEFLFFGP